MKIIKATSEYDVRMELGSSNGFFPRVVSRFFVFGTTKAPLSGDKRQPTDDSTKKTTYHALEGAPI